MKTLITGASSGLGKEFAKILVNKYDELVLVGRNKEKLEETKNELLKINDKANIKIVSTDLCNKESCIELYNDNKGVDLLVNNAGFGDYGYFDETDLNKDISMIETNVLALHILLKLYLKEMVERNSGHILNTASVAGFFPGPLMSTYYATKNYVVSLSEGIREELKRKKSKVKISILCPGPVKTNFEVSANVKFNFNGVNSTYIANYAIKHLNRFYIVPQTKIKLARIGSKLFRKKTTAKILYKIQAKRKGA